MSTSTLFPHPVTPSLPRPARLAPQEVAQPVDPPLTNTPYQRLKNSPVGRFVSENPLLSGVAGVGGAIVTAGASSQSAVFSDVAQYGIVPAVSAGVALVGAAAVHDAVVNDAETHPLRAAWKMGAGSVAALGGTQVIGDIYHIPVLDRALTGTLEVGVRNAQAIAGVTVMAGGAAAGQFAVERLTQAVQHAEHRGANALLGVGSATAAAGGVLGGLELVGRQYGVAGLDHIFTQTLETLARSSAGAVGAGTFALAGGAVLAQEAVGGMVRGQNAVITAAEVTGAAASALGGAELVGYGLGIEALRGLFTQHLDVVGSAGLAALGAAVTREAASSAAKEGLTLGNTSAAGLGATMATGGAALVAESIGFSSAAGSLGHGTLVVAGLGLGGMTAALGRSAVRSFRQGDVLAGLGSMTGGAVTASAGLGLVGYGLGVPGISEMGGQVFNRVVVPVFDHVIAPAARFLFENPVAGAVVLVAGVGAYAWYRHTHHAERSSAGSAEQRRTP